MPEPTTADLLAFALALADEADRLSMSFYRGDLGTEQKQDGTLVTRADRAVEAMLRERIAQCADAGVGRIITFSGFRRGLSDDEGIKNMVAGLKEIAPLAEEILFRGILYSAVKQAGFPRIALWGSVLLFAVVHMNAVTFVPLVVLALLLLRQVNHLCLLELQLILQVVQLTKFHIYLQLTWLAHAQVECKEK